MAITLDIKGALNVKMELVSHEDQENVEDLQSEEIELEMEGYVIKQEGSENSIKIEDTGNTKKKVNRTNIKTFSCDICEKSFRLKYYLKDHMITHVEDKQFQCNSCDKKFKRLGDLKVHMRKHSKEKLF